MARREKAPTGDEATTTGEGTAPAETTTEKRERPKRLGRMELIAQHGRQGGRCYVLGTPLDAGMVEVGGVLISKEANSLRGGKSLEELRAIVCEKVVEARQIVATFGKLVNTAGGCTFAGEDPATSTTAPSTPEGAPATA